ncbi:MAG: Cys-tRNA(Pro) deacylase [Clostridia bacterium]|nr:Cys-tRNA(Pro) deacylase [Clostridia bacterium]
MAAIKTNAMRILDAKNIKYKHYEYDPETTDGVKVAELLHEPREIVFKTLVTVAPSKNNYVFVIPVGESLDLKKAAKTVSEKSVAMIKQKELLPLTGYIHGGCSPVGMKKQFKTFIHESARDIDTFCISAGHVGNQIQVSVNDIAELIGAGFADLIC